jgi:hypothetical protein
MFEQCFTQRSTLSCIDVVVPGSEPPRGTCSGETLEQVRIRYPEAQLDTLDEFVAFKEAELQTEPKEVTEDKFVEMLEVLYPNHWVRRSGSESFQMSEHLSGNITEIYCRVGTKYFAFSGRAGMKHDDIVAKCRPYGA